MSKLFQFLYSTLNAPVSDGDGGGGAVDRGDNFTPTGDDAGKAADTSAADTVAAAEAAAEAAATAAAAKAAPKSDAVEDKSDDDQAREADGKFAKKEAKGVIPMDRHEKVLGKEREAREFAERQLAELQSQLQQVNRTADVTKLEEKLVELRKADRRAIMTGDEEKSVQLGAEIDRINRQINIQESAQLSAQDKEALREEIRTEVVVEKMQEVYPQLQEDSDQFDPDLVNFILAEQNRLIVQERMSPSKALTKAATDVMKRLAPAAAADKEGEDALTKEKKLGDAQKTADRNAAAVAKSLAAAKKTPPDTRDVGIDSDKAGIKDDVDVAKLSTAEFDALPEATKSRLRGDMV